MTYGRFKVAGKFRYRGHEIGDVFESKVTPQIARGVARGNIVCLELITPKVPDGYQTSKGWLEWQRGPRNQPPEAPTGRLSH